MVSRIVVPSVSYSVTPSPPLLSLKLVWKRPSSGQPSSAQNRRNSPGLIPTFGGTCHRLPPSSSKYIPLRRTGEGPALYISIQSSYSPCSSAITALFDAISSLITSIIGSPESNQLAARTEKSATLTPSGSTISAQSSIWPKQPGGSSHCPTKISISSKSQSQSSSRSPSGQSREGISSVVSDLDSDQSVMFPDVSFILTR